MNRLIDEVTQLLTEAGYIVEIEDSTTARILLAESPEALVASFASQDWAELAQDVFDIQAMLTHRAAAEPSAKQWDLYVVAFMNRLPMTPPEERTIEELESDTRFARKFVRILDEQYDRAALTRALLPLLPLRIAPRFDIDDPLKLMEHELINSGLSRSVISSALTSFRMSGTVGPE